MNFFQTSHFHSSSPKIESLAGYTLENIINITKQNLNARESVEKQLRELDAISSWSTEQKRKHEGLMERWFELKAVRLVLEKKKNELKKDQPQQPGSVCGKCKGTGQINHYAHVRGGICFRCEGIGTIN